MASLRHCYLIFRLNAEILGDLAIRDVNRAHQEALPGTPLPSDFPAYAKLTAREIYTTKEDLDGATARELEDAVGLTTKEAHAVLDAWRKL